MNEKVAILSRLSLAMGKQKCGGFFAVVLEGATCSLHTFPLNIK
jgi:hypothetical protein